MRKVFRRIGSLLLVGMILFSSFGFTVSSHYCGGEKIMSAIGFVKTDLSCGMKKRAASCPNKDEIRTNCCQNIFEYYHVEDNIKKEMVEIFVPDFAQLIFPLETQLLLSVALIHTYFNDFSPPLIVKNITIVHQTFLI